VPEGAKRVAIMLAAMMLARYATPNRAVPVIYLDHPESGLGVSYLSAIANFFRHDSNAITVAETCSGFLLRVATIRNNMKYYVIADGRTHEKLTLELFKQEVDAMSDVNAL
jgi:hypothetical protein